MLAIFYSPMISDHPGGFFDIISKGRDLIRYFLFDLLFFLNVRLRVTSTTDCISFHFSIPDSQSVMGNRR
jgi:hypothetical protein